MSVNNELVPMFDKEPLEHCKLQLSKLPDVLNGLIIKVSGAVDTGNATSFQRKVELAVMSGYHRILLDCEGLNYLSSTGVGSLVTILKSVSTRKGSLTLLGVQPRVLEVLELLGFTNFLQISTDMGEAIAYLKGIEKKEETIAKPASTSSTEFTFSVFPKTFTCPSCKKTLKATRSGKFRCSNCKRIIRVYSSGTVLLE